MLIVTESILPSTETHSQRHRTNSRKFPWCIVYGHYNWYTQKIHEWNNTKMVKNATFHIHIKSEHGYPEHVFRVIGLSVCRHGLDHKLRQITNCDGRDSWFVAICDCRNLWWFKIQLLKLMSIVHEGTLLSAENMFTSTSDPIKKVSFVHRVWAL